VSTVSDVPHVPTYDDGQVTPDEIFARVYPSVDVLGDDPMALASQDTDLDDLGGMPEPQATDDPHRDLPNLSAQDEDPDDL
jgi:hypothetical protein